MVKSIQQKLVVNFFEAMLNAIVILTNIFITYIRLSFNLTNLLVDF